MSEVATETSSQTMNGSPPDTSQEALPAEKERKPWQFKPGNKASPGCKGKRKEKIEPDDGLVTPEKMRKVLGQDPADDKGPTECRLREWLQKDPKGYVQEIERRAAPAADQSREVAALKAEVSRLERLLEEQRAAVPVLGGPDVGSEAALELIERYLVEAGRQS